MKNKLIPFLIPNTWMSFSCEHGYANGYVAIPPTHPCYGKHYMEIPIEVHGGLTFSEFATIKEYAPDSERQHKPEAVGKSAFNEKILSNAIFLTDVKTIPPDHFIVGFDTAHYGDTEDSCDFEFCKRETFNLATQLEEICEFESQNRNKHKK